MSPAVLTTDTVVLSGINRAELSVEISPRTVSVLPSASTSSFPRLARIVVVGNFFLVVVLVLMLLVLKELPPKLLLPLLRIADVTDTNDNAVVR